jgi:SAM-dependent methyltransferase
MEQAIGYVDSNYLQAAAELLAPVKERSYAVMNIRPGQHVLDVGCGSGIDTLILAQQVGDRGRVVGVDYDAAMVGAANRRAAEAGVGDRVTHRQADATALPFEEATFDAVRSERLFQHLHNPTAALAEMVRVTKPGGHVVVADTDWGTLSTDTIETETERVLARIEAERTLNNGYAGRQLYRLFKLQGLSDVFIEPFPILVTSYPVARLLSRLDLNEAEALKLGLLDERQLELWRHEQEAAGNAGLFFLSITIMLASGRKVE